MKYVKNMISKKKKSSYIKKNYKKSILKFYPTRPWYQCYAAMYCLHVCFDRMYCVPRMRSVTMLGSAALQRNACMFASYAVSDDAWQQCYAAM